MYKLFDIGRGAFHSQIVKKQLIVNIHFSRIAIVETVTLVSSMLIGTSYVQVVSIQDLETFVTKTLAKQIEGQLILVLIVIPVVFDGIIVVV